MMSSLSMPYAECAVPDDWPGREHSELVSVGAQRWHMQQHGDQGPLVLLVHGAGASGHSWQEVWPLLATNHRVIVIDLPGHGFSGPMQGAYTLPSTAAALDALLAQQRLTPAAIVGHSAGGAIAMQWALQNGSGATRFSVINPALLPFIGFAGFAFPAMARVMANAPLLPTLIAGRARSRSAVARLISGTGSRIPGPILDVYHTLLQSPSHVRSVLAMMAAWRLESLIDEWRNHGQSLCVGLGLLDRAVPPGRTRSALRGIAMTSIQKWPARGHLAHEESAEDIVDWLKREEVVA